MKINKEIQVSNLDKTKATEAGLYKKRSETISDKDPLSTSSVR